MSTQVMYKGSEIASFSNDTKTLKTSGKYLEGDISITDTSSAAAVVVTEEPDINGGVIKNITAVDISNDTVDAAHLVTGYTAHDRQGNLVNGAYEPNLITKTITENGTYSAEDDDADGYSEVTVNVSGGGGGSDPVPLTPIAFDYLPGYVNSASAWVYQDSTNNRSDIYQVEEGHHYVLQLGETVGARFRSVVIATNPIGYEDTIAGDPVSNKTDPDPYETVHFIASMDGYYVITKDNAEHSGIVTHLYDLTATPIEPGDVTFIDYDGTVVAKGDKNTVNEIIDSILSEQIAPVVTDQMYGWVGDNGIWQYEEGNTNAVSDVYEVEEGHTYYFRYGETVGTRFRSAVIPTSPVGATGTITGVSVSRKVNPSPYACVAFTATINGYYVVQKDSVSTHGIPTYLYEVTGDPSQVMPENPVHYGLTSQGWNYDIFEIADELAAVEQCVVGQMYTTDDGKTRIYIHIPKNSILTHYVRYTQSVSKGVTVDWGDGTSTTSDTTTSASNRSHTYANPGDYVITLTVNNGTVSFVGSSSYAIYGATGTTANRKRIRKIHFGNNVVIGNYACPYCYGMSYVTIPYGVTSIGDVAFRECTKLKSLILPSSVTSISGSWYSCYSLESASIPRSLTSIPASMFSSDSALQLAAIPSTITSLGSSCFNGCRSLKKMCIPDGVTVIPASTFSGCYGLQEVVIPNSVTEVGNSALNGGYWDNFEIPESIVTIGSSTFGSLFRNHTSITIPKNVTSIATSGISGANALEEYHFLPTTPPVLAGSNSLDRSGIIAIYVPYSEDHSVLEAYKTATNFSSSASIIFEEDIIIPESIVATLDLGSYEVYEYDDINTLKNYLTVQAYYADGSTRRLNNISYLLSGTIVSGTNTITVTHATRTTTFTVNASSWTWVYKGSDNVVLSARTDLVSPTIADTFSESIVDNLYHLAGTKAKDKATIFDFVTKTTNTKAVLMARVKFSKMSAYNIANGFRLQLSNGTTAIKAHIINNHIVTLKGTAGIVVPDSSILFGVWYDIRVELNGNDGKIYLDGLNIYESNQLSTEYAVNNRIVAQTTIVTGQESLADDLVVDIDHIGYKDIL